MQKHKTLDNPDRDDDSLERASDVEDISDNNLS